MREIARYTLNVTIILFVLCCFANRNNFAADLRGIRGYFLSGDYKTAIEEGEKALAGLDKPNVNLDELYYILGLSYMKEGNYLRASDIFEIILKEIKNSALRNDAQLALGDTYFMQADYAHAQICYEELLKESQDTKFAPLIYYRLSKISFKNGDSERARGYLDRLKRDYPSGAETALNKDIYAATDIYYTVQVGSFSGMTNARNLTKRLIDKGYPAYLEESDSRDKVSYRVRVGRARLRQEALDLEKKLSQDGYPTRIYP